MGIPVYQIDDANLDIIVKALGQQPWMQVNSTINLLMQQANSDANVTRRTQPDAPQEASKSPTPAKPEAKEK